MHFRLSLAGIRRFQLRARLGPSWRIGDSPLTDPTVQISRSGFVERIHHLASGSSPGSGQIVGRVLGT